MRYMNKTLSRKILPTVSSLFALALFAISANLVFGSVVKVANEFGTNPELFAMVATVQFIGFFISSIFGGILSDKYGRKIVILTALILLAGGALTWSFSKNIPTCYTGSFLLGLGGGILESLTCVILIDLFPDKKKLALNLSQVFYCLGAVGSLFALGYYMPDGISWRIFFFIMSIFAIILFAMFTVSHFPAASLSNKEKKKKLEIKQNLLKWSFIAPCIALFCYVYAEMGAATFINVFLQKHYNAPSRWAIYAIALFWLCMVIGRIICAFIPERISPGKIITILSFTGATLFIAQYFISSWQISIFMFALLGFSFAGIWPLIINLTTILNRHLAGTVVGITVAVGAVGCITAPAIMGILFSRLDMPLVWTLSAIPMIICGIVIMTLKKSE